MDFWIPLLGSALGGAVVTSIFSLIKNGQDKATEHAQWMRDTKQAAYAEFLSAMVEATNTLGPKAAAKESQRRFSIALSQIELMGTSTVAAAAVALSTPVHDLHQLSTDMREMIALDYSANEKEINAIGPQMDEAMNEIPALTKAFVRAARLDVGIKVQ